MTELVDEIPADFQTGLMVYGHRRKGDCKDIEHVIGFDISKEDQGRLRCLADKTGGLFMAADDAVSLRDALFKTVEEVKLPPPPIGGRTGNGCVERSVPCFGWVDFFRRVGRTAKWQGPAYPSD